MALPTIGRFLWWKLLLSLFCEYFWHNDLLKIWLLILILVCWSNLFGKIFWGFRFLAKWTFSQGQRWMTIPLHVATVVRWTKCSTRKPSPPQDFIPSNLLVLQFNSNFRYATLKVCPWSYFNRMNLSSLHQMETRKIILLWIKYLINYFVYSDGQKFIHKVVGFWVGKLILRFRTFFLTTKI